MLDFKHTNWGRSQTRGVGAKQKDREIREETRKKTADEFSPAAKD